MSVKNDINITPLIDIVLVLLIVFIIMVPGMQKSLPTVIPTMRPDITPPPPDPKNPPLVLEISRVYTVDGKEYPEMFINSSPIESLADIPDRVAPLVMLQPAGVDKRKVFLSADRDVPYRVVVNVMDQLRKTSEKVKIMTMEEGVLMGDGGETKIVVKLKKRPGE